jgi:hypothetical protein
MRLPAATFLASAASGFPLDFCFLFFLPFANAAKSRRTMSLGQCGGAGGFFPLPAGFF